MKAFSIALSDVAACPIMSLSPHHYREGEKGIECACGQTCARSGPCDRPASGFLRHPAQDFPICTRCRERDEKRARKEGRA